MNGYEISRKLAQLKATALVKFVMIRTGNDNHVCASCKELENKIVSIDDALEKGLVPNHACTSDKCRCWFVPITDKKLFVDEIEKILRSRTGE